MDGVAETSWIWCKLLKLRPLAYECLRYEVRNGEAVYFWFDNLLEIGKLIEITREIGINYLGVSRTATLADAVGEDGWNLSRCGERRFPQLCETIKNKSRPNVQAGPDIALWRHDHDEFKPNFSATKIWDYLRVKQTKVIWHSLVWFPQAVPRQSFMVWLALKDRLSTGVRMRGWGVEQGCVYCGEKDESRDYLYFACPYTFTVWMNVAGNLLGTSITPDWEETVVSLLSRRGNNLDTVLLRLVFQTSLYILWKERNTRRHGGPNASMERTTSNISKLVKNRISSLKYRGCHRLEPLLRRWFEVSPN